MFLFLKKFFMKRIESLDTLKEMGKRVLKEKLDYKIYNHQDDMMFEIYRGDEKIFEFVCHKKLSQQFLNEAVNF